MNKHTHVGYCEECNWEGYFTYGDKCKLCRGDLISVWAYKDNSSEAERMFKELGYNKNEDDSTIVFSKSWGNYDEQSGFEEWASFTFYLYDRTFSADETYGPKDISIDEYRAVTALMRELGWIND